MRPGIVGAELDGSSKLKADAGRGEGERPKPALERVGTSCTPFGVVMMCVGSWSWLIGVDLKSALDLELLCSVMKGGVVGCTSGIGEGQHEVDTSLIV